MSPCACGRSRKASATCRNSPRWPRNCKVFADTLAHPYCGSTSGFGTAAWFGEQAPHIRSQALIALCDGGDTFGMLALGSEDAQRFYAEMGTLYLERIGEMVSAALIRVAKPAQ